MARLALGVGIALLAWSVHRMVVHAEVAEAELRMQEQIALDRAASERAARQAEANHRAALRQLEQAHAQEMEDARLNEAAVVADLRAGHLRLQRLWRGCEDATARVPDTPATAGGADGESGLRAEAAARIVRAGAEADAQVRGLQAAVKACQTMGQP